MEARSELLKTEKEAKELRAQNSTLTQRWQHQREEIRRLNKVSQGTRFRPERAKKIIIKKKTVSASASRCFDSAVTAVLTMFLSGSGGLTAGDYTSGSEQRNTTECLETSGELRLIVDNVLLYIFTLFSCQELDKKIVTTSSI